MKIMLFAPQTGRESREDRTDCEAVAKSLKSMGHGLVEFPFSREMEDEGKEWAIAKAGKLLQAERPDLFLHVLEGDEADPSIPALCSSANATSVLLLDDRAEYNDSIKWAPLYDFALVTSAGVYERCRESGHDNVLLFPWGFDGSLHHPVRSDRKDYDVAFVGRAGKERHELVASLRRAGVGVHLWGEGWEDFSDVRDVARGPLPRHRLREILAASRIALGMDWSPVDGRTPVVSRGLFERAACGAFQLTNRNAALSPFFEEGREVACYGTPEECADLARHYLAHDEERERIAGAAYRRAVAGHSWRARFRQAFASMGERLSAGASGPAASEDRKGPRVSLLCYTFNFGEYLKSLIPSVLAQTFKDFELLILDDGSTDDTAEIVRRHGRDPRVRYVYQENMGKGGRNFDRLIGRCLELTTGELVSVVGGDDMLEPENLEERVRCFDEDPELDIVFHDATLVDAKGRVMPGGFKRVPDSLVFEKRSLLRTLFNHNIVGHPSALIRRSSVEDMGGFEMRFGTDTHFWLKSAPHLKFTFLDKRLIRYRVHEKGASTGESGAALTVSGHTAAHTEARRRCSILDIYPEIDLCEDKERAFYTAYVLAGNVFARATVFQPLLALREYERAREHRPDGIEALNNMAIMHFALHDVSKAKEIFGRLAPVCSDPAVLHNMDLFMRAMTGKAGNLDFKLLYELSSNSELMRVIERLDAEKMAIEKSAALGEAGRLAAAGRYDDAALVLGRLLDILPSDSETYSDLSFIHYHRKDRQTALACARRALELDPGNVEAKSNLAVILFDAGMSEEAVRACEEVLRARPDDVGMLLLVARLCIQAGLRENALSVYGRVLAIEPGNREAALGMEGLGSDCRVTGAAV